MIHWLRVVADATPLKENHEAHLSTQHAQTRQDPRIPSSHGHSGGPPGAVPSAGQGPLTSDRLNSSARPLKGGREFRSVRRGRSFRLPLLAIRKLPYRPRHGEPYRPCPLVGIVISKKTLARAVDRNRARRRLRAALAELSLPPCRAIVMPNKEAKAAPFSELKRQLEAALGPGSPR